jgi:2-keto-3-deoxy-L-rhamnonate aldolase RhmA
MKKLLVFAFLLIGVTAAAKADIQNIYTKDKNWVTEEEAKKFQALGVTFIGISSDQAMIKRGAQQVVKAMRS